MPVIKHADQRVGVFIDTQNLYHSAKHLHGSRADFAAILREAVAGRKLIRALAYVISTPQGAEHAFFNALNSLGIEVRKKEIKEFGYQEFKRASWERKEFTLRPLAKSLQRKVQLIVRAASVPETDTGA